MPPPSDPPRIVFAGDRDVSVQVLDFLLAQGVRPVALWVPAAWRASHADALVRRCRLPADRVRHGDAFRDPAHLDTLRDLRPDYLLSVHFPLLVPAALLALPRLAALNLHPSLLPHNRGWHTPSWALLDGTPAGATLHHMTEEVDAGDVVHQRRVAVRPDDTAHTLYRRIKRAELEVFREAWPRLRDGTLYARPQAAECATSHRRRDLLRPEVRRVNPDARVRAGDLIDRLRALTTDRAEEAAFVDVNGHRYRLRLEITEERDPDEK